MCCVKLLGMLLTDLFDMVLVAHNEFNHNGMRHSPNGFNHYLYRNMDSEYYVHAVRCGTGSKPFHTITPVSEKYAQRLYKIYDCHLEPIECHQRH